MPDEAYNSRMKPVPQPNATAMPTILLFLSTDDMIVYIANQNNMLVSFFENKNSILPNI
jgi:hypothetical protein